MCCVDRLNQPHLYVLFAQLLAAIYLLAGFYPFNLYPGVTVDNGVITTPDQHLHFRSTGIAYTQSAPAWLPHAIRTSSLELSLEVRTADRGQFGPARIFTLSFNRSRANLVVGQWGPHLSVRMRSPFTGLNGTPAYRIDNVFANPDWHQIDIAITSRTLEIRVDGKTPVSVSMPGPPMESWDPDYRLVLGNELPGDRPWLGDIRKAVVRINDRSFDYLAPGALYVPQQLTIKSSQTAKIIPFVDTGYSLSVLMDWAVNLLGFMPFGWLVVMARRPRPGLFLAVTFSAGISMTIEVGQLLLFTTRVPSTEDFILNTLGAALGAWIATRSMQRHLFVRAE